MPAQEKWRYDRKLTAMMVEDMIFDPILAGKVILNVTLPPHEELRVLWLWSTYFTNDDSGFSTGKSWTLAYICALRQALFKGRVAGMLSKTFAQGQLIFKHLERWANTSSVFRSCFRKEKGDPRITHASTAWVAYFKGEGEVRVLPPNFMQDSERLRSERWHDAYLDEWTTYGNFIALNKTIIGRVTQPNMHQNCRVRQNHIHMCSTPQFKHHPAYQMIQFIQEQIELGNDNYGRFTCDYRSVPVAHDYMIDRKAINHMQRTLPKSMVNAEVHGRWESDSGTFYNSSVIESRRYSVPKMQRTEGEEIFVGAFDTARGGGEQVTEGQGDDFALTVLKVNGFDAPAQHVLTIRKNKVTDIQMSGMIHEINQQFNMSMIGYDPGGGGLFVKDKLKLREQVIKGTKRFVTPILESGDSSGVIGDPILIPIRRSERWISRIHGTMRSESVLVNKIHNEMRTALTTNMIALARAWDGWDGLSSTWDASQKRSFLNETTLSDEEYFKAEMDLAVSQLFLVDVERDENGAPLTDSFDMYKFSSNEKKDSAYSLIYANFIASLYRFRMEHGDLGTPTGKSSVVYASSPIYVR